MHLVAWVKRHAAGPYPQRPPCAACLLSLRNYGSQESRNYLAPHTSDTTFFLGFVAFSRWSYPRQGTRNCVRLSRTDELFLVWPVQRISAFHPTIVHLLEKQKQGPVRAFVSKRESVACCLHSSYGATSCSSRDLVAASRQDEDTSAGTPSWDRLLALRRHATKKEFYIFCSHHEQSVPV